MAIIERAFSYGGILIRTFQHADSPPAVPQPASSGAPSPACISEQLPPPKRPRARKKRQANPPQTPIHLALSSLLTPDTTTSESGSLRDAEPEPSPALKDLPHYISLLTPMELRAIQTRNRRGKQWIPPESTVRKELVKLGRGINGETALVHANRSMAAEAPVQYMQETGRATDIDRFAIRGVLGGPSMQGESMFIDEHFGESDHGAMDGGIEWLAPRSVLDEDSNNGNRTPKGAGKENEYVHPYLAHGVTLPSPIPVSTKDDQQGLYLPPLSTHVTNSDSTNNSRSLVVKLSLPSTAQKPRALPGEPVPTPAQASSMGALQTQTPTPNFAVDSAPSAQRGWGRGRPRKSLHTIDTTQEEVQLIAAPQSLALSLSPTAPQPPDAPSPVLTYTPSQSSQKRKRTPLSPDTTMSPTLHFHSVPDLLIHFTSTVTSSSSGFIPRPVRVCYTLPKSALSAYVHEPGDKQYKAFGVDLVAQVSLIDKFQWRIAHSQWSISNGKHNPGARWVCNLSEEGSRDRGSRSGAPSGAGLRSNGSGDPPAPKTRYPCSGSISLRFSANKDIVSFKYSHHAVHAAPKEEDAQTRRVRLYKDPPGSTWGASVSPAQSFSNTNIGVDGGEGGHMWGVNPGGGGNINF